VTLDGAGDIYASLAGKSIVEYAAGAMGAATPIRDISGTNTHVNLVDVHDFDVASNGWIAAVQPTITTVCPAPWELDIYSNMQTGNTPPARTITGSNTMLTQGWPALAPDGTVFVAMPVTNQILVFSPTATGNVAPERIIGGSGTGLNDPTDLTIAPNGDLAALNQVDGVHGTITEYAPSASGNAAPINTITGIGSASSISFDGAGDLWAFVGSPSATVNEYSPKASGAATPIQTFVPAGITTATDIAAF